MNYFKTAYTCLFIFACLLRNTFAAMTIPKPIQEYLQTAKICEDNSLSSPGGGLKVIQDYLRGNWKSVLDNIETFAPTDKDKRKIILGCEALDDTEYLAFLQKTQELFAQRRIDMTVVEQALSPSEARTGFLAANWENPAVRSLMEKFRALIPADNYLKIYPDKVLSGKAKKELDENNRMYGESGPTPIPFASAVTPAKKTAPGTPLSTPASSSSPTTAPSVVPSSEVSPAKVELLTPKEPSSNRALLVSLVVVVLVTLGFFAYKSRK